MFLHFTLETHIQTHHTHTHPYSTSLIFVGDCWAECDSVMKRRVSADDSAVFKGQALFILPQLLIICFIIWRLSACCAASAAVTVERSSPQIKATIKKIRRSMEQTEAARSFIMGHPHTHLLGGFLSMTLLQQKVCVPRVDALVPADLGEEEKRCTFSL